MTLKILVTFVLPRGGVDKLTVVLVDGPCGVLGAHEGAIQRDTVKGQQPLAQQAHSGEPATIHNILSGGLATVHNILSGDRQPFTTSYLGNRQPFTTFYLGNLQPFTTFYLGNQQPFTTFYLGTGNHSHFIWGTGNHPQHFIPATYMLPPALCRNESAEAVFDDVGVNTETE